MSAFVRSSDRTLTLLAVLADPVRLELSRLAAHASERIAAPIASYMVGVALASRDTDSRVSEIRRLIEALEDRAGQQ